MANATKLVLALTLSVVVVLLWGAITSNKSHEDHIRNIEREKEEDTKVFGTQLTNLEQRIKQLGDDLAKEKENAQQREKMIKELRQQKKPLPPVPVVEPLPREFSSYVPPPAWGGDKATKRKAAKKEALITKQMAEESERRLASVPQLPWSPLGEVGVVLNAYGDEKYVRDALAVARNIKAVMPIKSITLWANQKNKPFLDEVSSEKPFIKPRYYEDVDIPSNVPTCPRFQAPPPMFLAKIVSLMHTTYDTTIVMDNDIHVCNNFEHLYPTKQRNYDVASAVAPFARWGGSKSDPYANMTLPNDVTMRQEYFEFQERNVGIMILRTAKPVVKQLIKDWLEIYTKETADTRTCTKFFHEQPAFREALFKLRGKISERLLPLDKVCREGDAIVGCQLKKGCATDGCDIVHCHVSRFNEHKTRKEIMSR